MSSSTKVQTELARGADASVINLVDSLIEQAQQARASDIHIDPLEKSVRIRVRVDGVLMDTYNFPKELHQSIISRIKVLAGLRMDEHQAAQDGRFRVQLENSGPVDVRISIVPTYFGENAVLRLLSDKAEEFSLEVLGFSKADEEKITKAIHKPYGMILSTGPTGSGKTTTLYTMIKQLNNRETSIVTIEDPIEYAVEGIEQIQVNSRSGLTFANGLRSILRQDPNVIMVGEIRDIETASIAVNTALTGHLLLSTVHTNDAATTLPRLLDMKIEPFLVASTVNIAIGQRLVRKLCTNCKEARVLTDAEKNSLSASLPAKLLDSASRVYYGKGCEHCSGTGFRGRTVIAEVLVVSKAIRDAILNKASSDDIKVIAIKEGMTPMMEDGIGKAFIGQTTLEEVFRVIHE